MSENGNDAVYGETPAETTSVFRADFLNELDSSSATQAPEAPVSGVEGLPRALLCSSSSVDRTQGRASCSTSRRRPRDDTPTATSSSTT